MVINRACGGGASATFGTKGSGCLEAMTVLMVLAKKDFEFASVDAFEQKVAWDAAVKAGDIVPLFEMYELSNNNTDPVYFESRNFKLKTKEGVKGFTWENYIDYCATAALRSYENSEYTRFFRVTEDGNVIGIYNQSTGGVRGQMMKDFSVGVRNEATSDKPGFVQVDVTMANFKELEDGAVIVTPDFDVVIDIPNVAQANIVVVTAEATKITVKAALMCGSSPIKNLALGDFVINATDGSGQSITALTETIEGTYELEGTFVSGDVGLLDIVTVDGVDYQSEKDSFTIS